MVIESALPLLPIGIVLIISILIMVSGKRPNLREFWSIAGSVLTFISVAAMVPTIWHGGRIVYTLSSIAPGINLNFRVDALSLIFGIVSSFLWIFASIYNIGYMRSLNEHAQTRYYTCFAAAIVGAQGVSYSGGLFPSISSTKSSPCLPIPSSPIIRMKKGMLGRKNTWSISWGRQRGFSFPP